MSSENCLLPVSMETKTLRSLTGPLVLTRTRAPDLESVKKLNCWGSEIEDISVVRQMPNLEVCSVSVNDITSLQDFQYCPNLQELYIRNNKIENLAEICYLKKLEKLKILWLADNPCANNENYKMTVLKNLTHLQKLDNVVVDEEDLVLAQERGEELFLPEEKPENILEATTDVIEDGAEVERPGAADTQTKEELPKDPITLSWEETNKMREQLGFKPLSKEKMVTPNSTNRARNAHILQAVLILLKELDRDNLEILDTAVKNRLDTL